SPALRSLSVRMRKERAMSQQLCRHANSRARHTAVLAAMALPLLSLSSAAQAPDVAEPFKVGTFEIAGDATVGLVLRDALIVDIEAANAALEREAGAVAVRMPDDMLELIERYDDGVRERLYAIVNHLAAGDRLGDA